MRTPRSARTSAAAASLSVGVLACCAVVGFASTARAAVPGPVTFTDISKAFDETVPAGVCSITFTAIGGSGGAGGGAASAGGRAGEVVATVDVTAGEDYLLSVGGPGQDGGPGSNASGGKSFGATLGGSGGNALDDSTLGGGGGGAVTFVTVTPGGPATIAAAGGGGGGGSDNAPGGNGGATGQNGTTAGQDMGGSGATAIADGAGGVGPYAYQDGGDGSGDVGGSAVNAGDDDEFLGGGGGAGNYGGGAGAGISAGAGGGGGANFAPTGYTLNGTATSRGSGSVTEVFHACATAPVFVHDTPSAGITGTAYAYTFTSTGSPAATYAVARGALPAGLHLDAATGQLRGTPTTAGTSTFAVSATNAAGKVVTRTLQVIIDAPAVLTADTPPTAAVAGTAYRYTFTATGFPAPTFSVADGVLPAGVRLDPVDGRLSGTPTTPGSYTFTIRAQNSAGVDLSRTLTIQVAAAQAAAAPVTPTGAQLPFTGTDTGALLGLGTVSLLSGLALRIAGRRRI